MGPVIYNFNFHVFCAIHILFLFYRTAYKGYTGGVLAIRRSQFEAINGFSNEFWGWGGEDDDLANRLFNKSYQVDRELSRGGYYYSLDHSLEPMNPQR